MTGAVLRLGPFDAERRWRPADLAELPAVEDRHAARVVEALEECLAALCGPGDVLVTRHPLPASFLDTLGEAGVAFVAETAPPPPTGDVAAVAPYAWVPETVEVAERHGTAPPAVGIVAALNSKTWSNGVAALLGLPGTGTVVRSAGELRRAVAGLGEAPALVKDPFGVAGRGCLELSSPRVLDTVARTIGRQAAAGRRVELLVQRRLPVRHAVSAHLDVAPDGTLAWRGLAVTDGRGFGYGGSRPAPPGLAAHLERSGHRAAVEAVAQHLAAARYHGPVCVDGLVLTDGTVVPLLEVNARMSMGRICLELDRRLAAGGLRARLVRRDLGIDGDATPAAHHARLVGALQEAGALARTGRPGVLPLTANTLRAPRGRLLCALVTREGEDPQAVEHALDACLASAGLHRTPRAAARVA